MSVRSDLLTEKLKALLKVLGVFLLLTGIWTLYRLWSVNLIIQNGELNWRVFFTTQIVFQPLLGLLPILLIVRYVEKRRLGSIGLSRRKFVRNAFFGISLSLFNSIALFCLEYAVLVPLGAGPLTFSTNPENLGLTSIFLMLLTFFLVVGPAEEIQDRGYFQTRLLEHFDPRFSIIVTSLLFAVAHIPIDVLIWRYAIGTMLFHLIGVFVAGSIMGYLYYRSGVLTGPIFLHALSDTQSFAYRLSFDYEKVSAGVLFGIEGVIYAVITIATFLLIRALTSKLNLKVEQLAWEPALTSKKGT